VQPGLVEGGFWRSRMQVVVVERSSVPLFTLKTNGLNFCKGARPLSTDVAWLGDVWRCYGLPTFLFYTLSTQPHTHATQLRHQIPLLS
jgi:hypothetical protein